MKQNLIVLSIITGILVLAGIVYYISKPEYNYTDKLKVKNTWILPAVLKEVSGISHIDDSRIACIQDEVGVIFIYDLEKKKIVDKIQFGPSGDYESIRIIDSVAYVMESSGKLFKIINFESNRSQIEIYQTGFSRKNDIESFDNHSESNTFLTIPKEKNLTNSSNDFIIYKINSSTYKVEKQAFSRITANGSIFETNKFFFVQNGFSPSELTIHPKTGEIFILDSKIPRLLILKPNGSFKKIYKLNPKYFQQPEGISFDSQGRMYVSNEESDFHKQNIQLVEWE